MWRMTHVGLDEALSVTTDYLIAPAGKMPSSDIRRDPYAIRKRRGDDSTDGYTPAALPPLHGVAAKMFRDVIYLPASLFEAGSVGGQYDSRGKTVYLMSYDPTYLWHEMAHVMHEQLIGSLDFVFITRNAAEAVAILSSGALNEIYGVPEGRWEVFLSAQSYAISPAELQSAADMARTVAAHLIMMDESTGPAGWLKITQYGAAERYG